jgi:hypothetical protein
MYPHIFFIYFVTINLMSSLKLFENIVAVVF